MLLEDVCDASYGKRLRQMLVNNHGSDFKPRDLTVEDLYFANQQVTAEMLDEIHCMLRHLSGKD